ncbi:hypothetical protein ABT186_28675 [Streptomyces sp. NPDC001634]|uniref:hypothetical protein n=1 Tax=Streptomyces sp. NPDC001634 TaxID=3154390 RepID=UPI0033332107
MVKTPPLEVGTAGRSLDWLPVGRTVSMRPAGEWWDAVRVPRAIALEALGRLGANSGAVIKDPGGGILYWLVPASHADDWQMPEGARIAVLGQPDHVAVPGPQRTAGPHCGGPMGSTGSPDQYFVTCYALLRGYIQLSWYLTMGGYPRQTSSRRVSVRPGLAYRT